MQIARRCAMVRSRWQCVADCGARYWGMQVEIARRRVLVGSRWQWVANGGAVLLGSAVGLLDAV